MESHGIRMQIHKREEKEERTDDRGGQLNRCSVRVALLCSFHTPRRRKRKSVQANFFCFVEYHQPLQQSGVMPFDGQGKQKKKKIK
mmetsp:Transcript_10829/g.12440  ORF Transcript_10829/g.12440 Transcript_10829/m.12440 type:complete len:86 (+) Transcript_10829:83-340(+)